MRSQDAGLRCSRNFEESGIHQGVSHKRVLPLYRQHNVPPLFWPDLASIHYSRDAVSWYESNQVAYVKKENNPPELHPIERYWAILKRTLMKKSQAALDIESFKSKLAGALKKISVKVVQNLMSGLEGKIRRFGRNEEI